MTESQAIDWLFAQQERGIHPGLDRMRALLAALDHPERDLEVVQVGGTNGKGSVTRMLSSILQAASPDAVGEYTSPHLHRFGERVVVAGQPLPDADLERHVRTLQAAHAQVPATFFELITALALLHFRDRGVRRAVLEVGLGGRLDATTAVPAVLSVITGVSLDHTALLGDTVEQIAFEKAGIVREGVPAITGASGAALEVIRARAQALHAPLWVLGEDIRFRAWDFGWEGFRLEVDSPAGRGEAHVPFLGEHQARNAAIAVAAALRLGVNPAAIAAGLARARWPGRLERIPGRPAVLLDAAHNGEGAEALAAFVRARGVPSVTLVVAGLRDKDLERMAAPLRAIADRVIATRPRFAARAAEALEIAAHYPGASVAETVPEALERAREVTPPDGLIVVAGTIPLVAEAREALLGLDAEGRVRWQ